MTTASGQHHHPWQAFLTHAGPSSGSSSSESSPSSSPLSPTFFQGPTAARRPSSGFQVLSRPANRSQTSVTASSLHSRDNSDKVPSPSSRPASLVESPASASQETTEMSTSSSSVLPPVTNVLVTQDGDTLAKCDLTGSTDSLVIREKIYSKLRIADAEQDRCSIHRGRFQAGQEGPPLTDQDLWDLCKDIAPSSSSPPLLFVSITGPTLGTAPLAPQNSAMYGIENKVASLAAEEEQQQQQQASNSGHALRSSNPKWHKSRASDPDSSPRSPPLPQGAQFVSTPSSRSGGGASSRNDFFLRPTSPPNGTDEPFIPFATQGGEGRRASSESSRSNPSAGRLPVGAVDARRAPVEAFNDPNYQEWIDHSRSADRPGVSSSASSSSRQDPARQGPYSHAPSTSSSGVAPPPPRHIQHWESQAHSQSQPSSSSQRLRKTSLDEQAHLRQAASRQEWDPQRPPSHPKSKSSTGYMMPSAGQTAQSLSSRHQDIIPPPLRAPRSQQFFNNPAGFGSSGPVFRASHPSHPAGRLPPHYAPHSQSGFGPSGPAGPRVGLPPSVRPGPHPSSSSSHPGPSRSASRIPQQPPPSMRPTHSSSQSTPLHPSAAVASNRSLHAARSVDDLRHRTRPSAAHEAMPPLPPSMQQTRSQTRWPQEDVVPRPATTSSASRMPFPGTSQPANPASTSGHAARSHPTASFPPPQLQPRASPYPAYSGAPPPPPSRSQQGSSRSPRLPPASRSSPGNHLHPQTEFQGTDSSGAALRRSPACNTVAIDYHNSLPLQPGGTLQDALRPKESERRVPKSQAPPTQDLPTNLRAGVGAAAPPRSIQVSRRQNSGPDPSRSPVMAAGEHRFPTHTPTSSTGSMASPREGQLPFPGSPPASLPSNSTSQPSTPRPGSSSSANRSSGPSPEQSTDDAYAGTVIDDDQRRQSDRPPSLSHSASTRNSSILASPHDESAPGLPISSFEPSAPPLWEDDLPEFSEVLQPNERVGATAREEEESEEQATVKGEDWADILRKIQEGEADVDQLVPYATGPFPDNAGSQDVSTLPADPGSSGQSTMVEGTPSTSQASWGCSMEDFDDDDSDDERTWAVAPGTARPREVAEIREANERIREANASKVSPRPSLSLQIENLPMPAGPGESSSDSPPKTRQLEPTPSSEPLDDQWAVRPSVERVYDNLERFFPDHDLDKPIVDAGAPPVVNSPVSSPTPNAPQLPARAAAATPSPSTGPPPTELQRFKHKKSIRIVAQDRKRLLQRAESAVSRAVDGAATRASGLLRRKSTKLWGIRTEEVTPRQAKLAAPPSAGPSTGLSEGSCDPESASFKWMKGELIGKGSYGKVYLGFNVTTGDMLAVKQVEMPQTTSDKDNEAQSNVVNALKSEIGMLQDFDHVNIVQFLGYNESPEYLSIFLEYVPGGSIGRCIRKNYAATRRGFEESLIKDFTGQILSGLAYLHERGVLHRDLKADNVLVDMAGTCKISDFGISKKSEDIYNDNVEMSMQGSIFWMAPEVIDSGKRGYSAKVDIWSLGCVALEMVSGRRPFHEYQMMQALFKLGAGRMAPPVPEDVTVSSEATEFMARCFTINPVGRPTAIELQSDPFMMADEGYTFEQTSLARMLKAKG